MNLKPNRIERGSWNEIGLAKARFLVQATGTPLSEANFVSAAAYCDSTPELVSRFVAATVSPLATTSVFDSAKYALVLFWLNATGVSWLSTFMTFRSTA